MNLFIANSIPGTKERGRYAADRPNLWWTLSERGPRWSHIIPGCSVWILPALLPLCWDHLCRNCRFQLPSPSRLEVEEIKSPWEQSLPLTPWSWYINTQFPFPVRRIILKNLCCWISQFPHGIRLQLATVWEDPLYQLHLFPVLHFLFSSGLIWISQINCSHLNLSLRPPLGRTTLWHSTCCPVIYTLLQCVS